MPDSDIFWDQLLELIDEGKVVPIVGQDLLTVPESTGHTLLYPLLAQRLAKYLGVGDRDLPPGGELNEIACRYIAKGKPVQRVYAALKTVATEAETLPIPEPLLQLAAIRPMQLFVSTTFDSSMTRALNEKRFGGQSRSRVFAHAPNEMEDLPDVKTLAAPVVYHLLGKLSATPAYVITDEDLVEFFHSLQSDTRRPVQLFDDLSGRSILLLGTRFSGWLTSFLMRMSKRQRLSSDDKTDYVVDEVVCRDEDLVLFLERFSTATEIYRDGGAVAFVDELYRRWTTSHPDTAATLPVAPSRTSRDDVEPGAVFLSYASADWPAVEKIKVALEARGVDVFFDRDQLKAGNEWEGKLRRTIHQCSLFVPVISRQTLTPDRRFFRVEWNLALEEAQMASFSSDEAFLLPVLIDDTTVDDQALPAKFRAIQCFSLPGGDPSPQFLDRIQTLYRKYQLTRMAAR